MADLQQSHQKSVLFNPDMLVFLYAQEANSDPVIINSTHSSKQQRENKKESIIVLIKSKTEGYHINKYIISDKQWGKKKFHIIGYWSKMFLSN